MFILTAITEHKYWVWEYADLFCFKAGCPYICHCALKNQINHIFI